MVQVGGNLLPRLGGWVGLEVRNSSEEGRRNNFLGWHGDIHPSLVPMMGGSLRGI